MYVLVLYLQTRSSGVCVCVEEECALYAWSVLFVPAVNHNHVPSRIMLDDTWAVRNLQQ